MAISSVHNEVLRCVINSLMYHHEDWGIGLAAGVVASHKKINLSITGGTFITLQPLGYKLGYLDSLRVKKAIKIAKAKQILHCMPVIDYERKIKEVSNDI